MKNRNSQNLSAIHISALLRTKRQKKSTPIQINYTPLWTQLVYIHNMQRGVPQWPYKRVYPNQRGSVPLVSRPGDPWGVRPKHNHSKSQASCDKNLHEQRTCTLLESNNAVPCTITSSRPAETSPPRPSKAAGFCGRRGETARHSVLSSRLSWPAERRPPIAHDVTFFCGELRRRPV